MKRCELAAHDTLSRAGPASGARGGASGEYLESSAAANRFEVARRGGAPVPPKDVGGRRLAASGRRRPERPAASGRTRAEDDSHHERPQEGVLRLRQRGRLLRGLLAVGRRAGERAAVALQNKDEREPAELLGARRRSAEGESERRICEGGLPDAEAAAPRAALRRDARDALGAAEAEDAARALRLRFRPTPMQTTPPPPMGLASLRAALASKGESAAADALLNLN